MGENVYEAEIKYLVTREWAQTLEDILWRRSKLGLHTTEETQKKIRKLLKKLLGKQEAA
jgi:glycerol-3-phosphate dehydrogenase